MLKELAKEIKAQETKIVADKYLLPARMKGYICECGNGTKASGTGAEIYFNRHNNRTELKCQSCGKNLNNLQIIAYGENLNLDDKDELRQAVKIGCEIYGLSFDTDSPAQSARSVQAVQDTTKTTAADDEELELIHNDIHNAQNNLASFVEKHSGNFRGLSLETLKKFNCGFLPQWISPKTRLEFERGKRDKLPPTSQRFIVPTKNHYVAVMLPQDRTTENKKYWKMHAGSKEIFGAEFLPADVDLIWIVEGEIDAMSIWQATQCKCIAIATGGAAEKRIVDFLKNKFTAHKPHILILFDNDDAGRKNAPKLREELLKVGLPAVCKFLSDDNSKIDANEFLQVDSEGFKARLTEIYGQANLEFEQMEREKMKAAGIEVLADVFDGLDEMSDKLKGKVLKWGFPTLDKKLPMLPGCYLLGALPSLGKTTFALNVAANICEQGEKVLYISYEPTKYQIAVKDLTHYWFMKEWGKTARAEFVPTASQIMLGRYNEFFPIEEMQKVREELKAKRRNFYFLQGTKEKAQDLISKIQKFVDDGVKFIVIDYLQLIKGSDTKTMREQVDETVRELQMFQAKNNLVILFISSFNRENYRNFACLESFKESGGLEYTSDAILALQFEYATGESRQQQELFQKKKESQPRNMELVCLKNRFGIDFVDRFSYHSKHETFIEKIESKKNDKVSADEIDEE